MKFSIYLITTVIFQLFIAEYSLACKTSSFAASLSKMEAVIKYVSENSLKSISNGSEIKLVRKDKAGLIVEILDEKGKCTASLYTVTIQPDCKAEVSIAPTFAPIDCQ